ncbi:MAG: hypothetical protein HY689_08230 [Chloroflexi bacterium]|nr:hypothetical protein [Chloroflexota bacterium]
MYNLRAYTYIEDGTQFWGARIVGPNGETIGELYDLDEQGLREQLAEGLLQARLGPDDFDGLSRDEVALILQEYQEKYG